MTSTAETAELLRLYFIQQQSVSLPGIGSFELNRIPARVDHSTGVIEAPTFSIRYDSFRDIPSKELFAYISRKKNISEWEAIGMVNNFSTDLKDQLKKGRRFEWEGMGSLENSMTGQLIFTPVETVYEFMPALPIAATGTVHHPLPPDYQELPYENEESGTVVASTSWWVAAAVIAAVALVMIFFGLVRSEYRLSGARNTKVVPANAPSQYESKPAY